LEYSLQFGNGTKKNNERKTTMKKKTVTFVWKPSKITTSLPPKHHAVDIFFTVTVSKPGRKPQLMMHQYVVPIAEHYIPTKNSVSYV
jgi:hypothetical protein